MRSPAVGNNGSGLKRNRHIPTASGAERTSGSLLQDGLFLCGPRGVTNTAVLHRLARTGLATPFRSENVATGLPQDGTNSVEACSFNLVPIGSPVPGSLPSHLRGGASTVINSARPGLPHILSAPTEVTHPGLRASIACRGVRWGYPFPSDGRVISFSVDNLPMIGLKQSRSRYKQSPADPQARSFQG